MRLLHGVGRRGAARRLRHARTPRRRPRRHDPRRASGRGSRSLARASAVPARSQCGFCTPGIIMRLAALPGADEATAERALLAHLCRCTGWKTIARSSRGLCRCDSAPAQPPVEHSARRADARGWVAAAGVALGCVGRRRVRRRHRAARRAGGGARRQRQLGRRGDVDRSEAARGQGSGPAHDGRAYPPDRRAAGRVGSDPPHHLGRARLPRA